MSERSLSNTGLELPRSLLLKSKQLADGLYAGGHASLRRGAGVEFDGHRQYMPGDDLRRLDYRALARHDQLLIRQFETETERSVCVLLDASASMGYQSGEATQSKLDYSALVAAVLCRLAVRAGDLISLDWFCGKAALPVGRSGGRSALQRAMHSLEHAQSSSEQADPQHFERLLALLARRANRGSIVVFVSDLLDLPEGAAAALAALSGQRRQVVCVRVLDPVEATFPFKGAVRLVASGADHKPVETDASQSRKGYLAALAAQKEHWQTTLQARGGRVVACQTTDAPLEVLRGIVRSAGAGDAGAGAEAP